MEMIGFAFAASAVIASLASAEPLVLQEAAVEIREDYAVETRVDPMDAAEDLIEDWVEDFARSQEGRARNITENLEAILEDL